MNMDAWNSLVKTALLGTNKGFMPPVVPDSLQDALNLIPKDDRDTALFSTAAFLGIAQIAGTIPNRLEETNQASPAESMRMISEEAGVFLKRILGGEHEAVLPEFLSLTSAHKRIVVLGRLVVHKRVASVIEPGSTDQIDVRAAS